MKYESITVQVKETAKDGFDGKIEVPDLAIATEKFKELISVTIPANPKPSEMKLIHKGIILKDGLSLTQQGITSGAKVLLFKTAAPAIVQQVKEDEDKAKRLEKLMKAAEEVASRSGSSTSSVTAPPQPLAAATVAPSQQNAAPPQQQQQPLNSASRHLLDINPQQYYFELEDQNGNKLNLPIDVRKNLITGMTLHSKGKDYLAAKKYLDAYDCFKLSDECFLKVVPQDLITSAFDNYALCQVDMVWCMFHLKDSQLVIEAKQRLLLAKQILERVHGKDLSRLKQVKQATGSSSTFIPEAAIYPRLHLLIAIADYHGGNTIEAKKWLTRAQAEIDQMRVKDEHVQTLVNNMGFKESEAKRALMATQNDVSNAINFILNERAVKQAKIEQERKERMARRRQVQYGRCANGSSFVNVELLDQLKAMFSSEVPPMDEDLIVYALKQTNNKEELAIQFLTDSYKRQYCEKLVEEDIWKRREPSAFVLKQVMDMGFEETISRFALRKCNYSVQNAINLLLAGNLQLKTPAPSMPEKKQAKKQPEEEVASVPEVSNQSAENVQMADTASAQQIKEQTKEEEDEEDEEETADDIIDSELGSNFNKKQQKDVGSDIQLDEEYQILQQYQKWLL